MKEVRERETKGSRDETSRRIEERVGNEVASS